jgi:acetate kinase
MKIFVFNPGSSSLKFGLYDVGADEAVLMSGVVERIGTPQARLRVTYPQQAEQPLAAHSLKQAAQAVFYALDSLLGQNVAGDAFACRVVHGGSDFFTPTVMTPETLHALSALDDLAPLHNRAAIDVMETVRQISPHVPLVAVFDTAFHQTLPEVAYTYALPAEFAARHGLRRYGFHGISHRWVSECLLKLLNRPAEGSRLITCHLGNGASVCALRDGKSVETSMGFTPLEGLVMGTRSGDLDPGLVLHLLRTGSMSADSIDDLLNHQSGLLGISGISGDVRELERAAGEGNSRAKLALELFAYRVCKYIGAYAAVLEGLDTIAFTGGIGEHSAVMRERICCRLKFLGIQLDTERNQQADSTVSNRISSDDSRVSIWLIPTHEEQQIAVETDLLLAQTNST